MKSQTLAWGHFFSALNGPCCPGEPEQMDQKIMILGGNV